jgi:hypothetical protein
MTSVMASSGNGQTTSGLAGAWHLDKTKSELSEGLRPYQTSLEQALKIDVVGDVVTVVTTTVGIPFIGALGMVLPPEEWPFAPPPPPGSAAARAIDQEFVTTQRLEVDGHPHRFNWGDTIPPETGSRTITWLPNANGFEIVEDFGSGRTTHRWSISVNGETLTVESTQRARLRDNRLVRVFTRQH